MSDPRPAYNTTERGGKREALARARTTEYTGLP